MKNIILTGASDGLGKEFRGVCKHNNINVIALCRTKQGYYDQLAYTTSN
ncbi:MAG: hypothetical protein HFJ59_08145 [Clostridia bacterium]|nr:hypothetical protein [Clostridia bacterium]